MRRPNYATPFADLFRPLTVSETASLQASIQDHGVKTAVVVFTSAVHGPAIIDGANRWELSGYLGVECPVNDLGAMPDDDARKLAEELNLCRRHLTPADWTAMQTSRAERVKRVAEKRRQGKTQQEIADEEGISKPQVQRDLKAAVGTGVPTEPDSGKVTGKDGKTYKASKPAKPVIEPTPEDSAQTAQPDTDDDDVTVIGDDDPPGIELSHADPLFHQSDPAKPVGVPLLTGLDAPPTEVSLIAKEAVAKYAKFRRWVLSLGKLNTEFADLMTGPGTHYLRNLLVDGEPVLAEVARDTRTVNGLRREKVWVYPPLVKFIEFVKSAFPHKVCQGCRGHGLDRDNRTCAACGSVGYLPVVRLPPPAAGHLPFAPAPAPWEIDDLPED